MDIPYKGFSCTIDPFRITSSDTQQGRPIACRYVLQDNVGANSLVQIRNDIQDFVQILANTMDSPVFAGI